MVAKHTTTFRHRGAAIVCERCSKDMAKPLETAMMGATGSASAVFGSSVHSSLMLDEVLNSNEFGSRFNQLARDEWPMNHRGEGKPQGFILRRALAEPVAPEIK